MSDRWDVIVIGAGFAGATAARECASRGLRVLVLEARDRIGGRSGSRPLSDGSAADVGGTFVHWTQPHLWGEISRYGLEDDVVRGRVEHDWIATYANGETTWSPATEMTELTRRAMSKVAGKAADVFPNPAQPLLAKEALEAVDGLTVTDGLARLDLDAQERAVLEASLGGYAGRPADEASWSANLRWFAMGLDNYDDLIDMLMNWKLECGTGALISRILADGGAEVRLQTVVQSVSSHGDEVTVTLADGQRFTGATAIVAVPANVWSSLDFSPALNPQQFEASQAGMSAPWAGKAVAIIKGESRSMLFSGDPSVPISFFTASFRGPDEQLLAIYPMDPSIDISDTEVLRVAITTALPHVTVVDTAGDRYLEDDPFFRGGWGFLRPGQLTKYVPHENFTRLDDRVVFATSDIAKFFHGFIDGAIESGLRAAREVRTQLANDG
jgi:nicotine oxidoreductase